MKCHNFPHVKTGKISVFAFVMSYCQLHFISTLQIAVYPVRLSFNRQNLTHFENSTETFSSCFSVDNKHFCVIHAIREVIGMRIYDNDIREAVDCIKLHLVPQVSVPGTYSVWPWVLVTVNSKFCVVNSTIPTKSATLRYSRMFDWVCSCDK